MAKQGIRSKSWLLALRPPCRFHVINAPLFRCIHNPRARQWEFIVWTAGEGIWKGCANAASKESGAQSG